MIVLQKVAIVAAAIEIPVVLVVVKHKVFVVLVARTKDWYKAAQANVLLQSLIRITTEVHQLRIQLHVSLQCTIKVLPVHKLHLLAGYSIAIDQLQQRVRVDRLHHVQFAFHIATSTGGQTPLAELLFGWFQVPQPGEQRTDRGLGGGERELIMSNQE